MDEHETTDDRALGALVRSTATRHVPPAALRDRIAASIAAAGAEAAPRAAANATPTVPHERRAWWRFDLRSAGVATAAFACGAIVMFLATSMLATSTVEDRIENDVVSAHVRAVMMARATDVASSDQHTVKPWLSSRLDFSPAVTDLAMDGFPLVGGRLDYVGGRTVATLVYQRNKHWIDVFVWPAGKAGKVPPERSRNGLHMVVWEEAGLRYWAVSDVAPEELEAFAELLRKRTGAS